MRGGVKGFIAKISGMPAGLEAAMTEAVAFCAARAAEEARNIAPVDSGELRAGIAARRDGHLAAVAVSTAAHAAMVEFGTLRMRPRPYMQPAARAVEGEFFKAARRAAGEVLK